MKNKVKIMRSANGKERFRWAFQTLLLSICLSIVFGFLSQTLLSRASIIISSLSIFFFIVISVLFDMFGIAVASADEDYFKKLTLQDKHGSSLALTFCQNSEKVCSFCADVVGDICSTLSGAAGACIVVSLTQNIQNNSLILLISTLMSAFIAGITIFFKALMKEIAITKSNEIILKVCKTLQKNNNKKIKK